MLRQTIGFAVLVLVLAPLAPVAAAPPQVTISFEPGSVVSYAQEPPVITEEKMYIVAVNLDREIDWFEIGLDVDPRLTLYGGSVRGGGIQIEPCGMYPFTDWICGTVECVTANFVEWLVELRYGVFDVGAKDLLVCAEPPSAGSTPAVATYRGCDDSEGSFELFPTHINVPAGCAVVNPTKVLPAETASWGAVKTRFGQHD